MPNVELGFLETCETWKLHSRLFPSKVGGKPAWLSLKPLPTGDDLTCQLCSKILVFLCQIYAPYEPPTSNQLNPNFHRSIFVFICRNSDCNKINLAQNIKVYRSALPKKNDFYSVDPPEDKPDPEFEVTKWSELCDLCGIVAHKRCSQCKNAAYCCRDHQVLDWKNGHKLNCTQHSKNVEPSKRVLGFLFSEWELIIEREELHNEFVSERQAMEEYRKLQAEGKTGTLDEVSESDLDLHASPETDKIFAKFKSRIEDYPDQVIRYCRGGEPLFIAKEPLPSSVPDCDYCRAPRQFEFQIMPQMLSELKEHDLDWGVLLVYTCKDSCTGDSVNSYKKEFVFRQDVMNTP